MDLRSVAKRPNRTGHGSRQKRNEKHIRHLNSITASKLDEYLEDFKKTFERQTFKDKVHDLMWCITPKKPVETQVIDYYKCDLFDLTENIIKNKRQKENKRIDDACGDEDLVHVIKPCFDCDPNVLNLSVEVVNTKLPTSEPSRPASPVRTCDNEEIVSSKRVEIDEPPRSISSVRISGCKRGEERVERVKKVEIPKDLPTKSKDSTICIHALRRSVVIFTPNKSRKIPTVPRNLNVPLSGVVLKTNRINTIIKLKSKGYACIAHIPPPNYAIYRGIRDYTRKLVEHNILVFQSYNELDYDVTICRRFDCFKRHRVLRGVTNKVN